MMEAKPRAMDLETRRPGFTLVEMMVAVALAVIIIAVVVTVFGRGSRIVSMAHARTEAMHNASVALDFLERDLKAAYLDPDGPVFQGQPDTVSFYTNAEQAGGAGASLVTYLLGTEALPDGTQVGALRRQAGPPGEPPATDVPVGLGVIGFSLRYFRGGQWTDTWDSTDQTAPAQYRRLPECVEVTMQVVDTRGHMQKADEPPVYLSRLIALPGS